MWADPKLRGRIFLQPFLRQQARFESIWSDYSDLTRPISPTWWFNKGNPLISRKSRLLKYYSIWPESIAIGSFPRIITRSPCYPLLPQWYEGWTKTTLWIRLGLLAPGIQTNRKHTTSFVNIGMAPSDCLFCKKAESGCVTSQIWKKLVKHQVGSGIFSTQAYWQLATKLFRTYTPFEN